MHLRGNPDPHAPRISYWVMTAFAVFALVMGTAAPSFATSGPVSAAASGSVQRSSSVPVKSTMGVPVKMSLAGFSAGNIISDAVFTDTTTMSEAQIQSFFNSKVTTCRGGTDEDGRPIVCIKDFRMNTVNRPADTYCKGYTGASGESAARIIYRVSQSCGINPQVLIVMLQKEQSLVTHSWPSAWRYDKALGQGCPDGGVACDPKFVGFFHQVYGAARQMQLYMEGRYFKWYAPGNTWNLLWHPPVQVSPGVWKDVCGSSPVYIANKATSALYYYTPYQPNAAALNAGYGLGDSCSSYGNRNFYNYFTDWFGSTQQSGARVLRDASTNVTYLVTGGTKYAFPNAERAAQFTWISPVQSVPSSQLTGYTDGGTAPRAIRTDQGGTYLLDSGRKLTIPSCQAAKDYGWDCAGLPVVGQSQANAYPDGGYLAPSLTADGSTWLIQSAVRREIVDTSLLAKYGISTATSPVAGAFIKEFSLGDPVLGPGIYSDAGVPSTAVLGDGSVYTIPTAARVDALRTAARAVSGESLKRLKPVADLPLAVSYGGRSYVLSNAGWLMVDAYGKAVTFTALASDPLSAMPSGGTVLGPHFARERSSLQVTLISGGAIQKVTPEEQRWITAAYGVSATVHVVADTLLGMPLMSGRQVVRTPGGAYYLVDATSRYRLRDCAQVVDWGAMCDQALDVALGQLDQLTDRGWLNSIIRLADGTTWFVQAGTRREVIDPAVLAPYGISSSTTTVPLSLAQTLGVGVPVLDSGVYSDGGSGLVLVNTAGTYAVSGANRLSVVTSGARRLTAASYATLKTTAAMPARLMSDGRTFVITELGWLQVDAAQYGGAKLFTSLPSRAWEGVPVYSIETRPHFVRSRSNPQMFLVSGGMLQPIEDDAARMWVVGHFGVPSYVWQVSDDVLKRLSLPTGAAFKDADDRILLSDGTTYYQLANCQVASDYAASCSTMPSVDPGQLAMTNGGPLAALLRGPAGDTWLLQGGVRREVPDPSVLAAYGIGTSTTTVSGALITSFPIGDPVVTNGAYRSGSAMRLITATGRILDVPAAAQVDVLSSSAKTLTDGSFARLRATGALTVRAQDNGSSYVLSVRGWIRMDPHNLGSLVFPVTATDVVAAIPSAGTEMGPRFVRETSSAQVYLASGGLSPVSAEDQAYITRVYGVPSTVLVLADGTLR